MAISRWTRQKRALAFLLAILLITFPILVRIAWPFLTSFTIAAVLAIIVHPAKEWLSEKIHRPGLATFLITLAIVSLLGIVLTAAGFRLTGEVTDLYNALNQRSLEEGGWPAMATATAGRIVDALAKRLPVDKEAIRAEIMDAMKSASAYLLRNIGIAVEGLTNFVITGLLVTLFLYFLLKYGKEWVARIAAMTPLTPRATVHILNTIRDSVVANVNGMLAVALAQGALLSLGFWFVGVHSPVLWGALGGIASIVPVIGALLVWVPVAIGFLLMGAYWKALILGLWGFLVVGMADNIVRPLVVGAREKQHPMLVALATIGGTYAFGALGILLGPLMVSLVAAVLKEMQLLAGTADAEEDPEAETVLEGVQE